MYYPYKRKLAPSTLCRESRREAFHGGAFFEAIGVRFDHLDRAPDVISADVLDAWFDPSPRVLQKIHDYLPFLARTSPPVRAAGLIQTIAQWRGVDENALLVGGGSSDLIFACLPHLVKRQGKALILDPMYGEYSFLLETVMDLEVARFALAKENNFRVVADEILAAVKTIQPDLVVVVNPNSPTGQHWPLAQLLYFLDSIPDSIKVVVDETYVEYVGGGCESMERAAAQRPNLIVIKSMSKVYALSGMRVGYLVAHPTVIRQLAPWIPPWSVSLPAQVAAVEALDDPAYYQGCYQETERLRDGLMSELAVNPEIKIYPSAANFLLVETTASAQIIEKMSRSHVFVRNCDSMSAQYKDAFIRITVKSAKENARLAETLHRATGSWR